LEKKKKKGPGAFERTEQRRGGTVKDEGELAKWRGEGPFGGVGKGKPSKKRLSGR